MKVEWKKLGEVCSFNRGRTITAKDAVDGEVPVIAGGQVPSYYHNEANRKGESIVVAGSGAYAGFISYWNQPIFVSDAFTVDPTEELNHKYLFHWLKMNQASIFATQKGAGVPHVHGKDIANFTIPVPSLSEQERIVGILDTFTSSVENLKEQIAQRRKQYEHYRDQLLDLEGKEGVEMKMLGDACEIRRGIRVVKKQLTEDALFPVFQNSIAPMGYYDEFNRDGNMPYIICAGSSSGSVGFCSTPFWAADDCYTIESSKVNKRYAYYALKRDNNNLFRQVRKGSMPRLPHEAIDNMIIPVPSLSEQARIVSILDTFEASIRNLEAQLSERQKQYEYYRNQLLTFE